MLYSPRDYARYLFFRVNIFLSVIISNSVRIADRGFLLLNQINREKIVDVCRHVSRWRIRIRYFPSIMYSFRRSALETHLNTIATCISVDTRSYLPSPLPPCLDYRIISRVSALCRRNPTFVAECIHRLTAGIFVIGFFRADAPRLYIQKEEKKRARKKKRETRIQRIVTRIERKSAEKC